MAGQLGAQAVAVCGLRLEMQGFMLVNLRVKPRPVRGVARLHRERLAAWNASRSTRSLSGGGLSAALVISGTEVSVQGMITARNPSVPGCRGPDMAQPSARHMVRWQHQRLTMGAARWAGQLGRAPSSPAARIATATDARAHERTRTITRTYMHILGPLGVDKTHCRGGSEMQKTGPAGAVITFGSLRTRLFTSISCPSTHAL